MKDFMKGSVHFFSVVAFSCFLATGFWNESLYASSNIIYHAFDENYPDLRSKLPWLSHLGFTHIQISPPTQSRDTVPHPLIDKVKQLKCESSRIKIQMRGSNSTRICSPENLKRISEKESVHWEQLFTQDGEPVYAKKPWYLHYQTSSYEIGDSYGDESELRALIIEARKNQMNIIVDVVFTHFRSPDGVDKAEWDGYRREHPLRKGGTISDEVFQDALGREYYDRVAVDLQRLLGLDSSFHSPSNSPLNSPLNSMNLDEHIYRFSTQWVAGGWPSHCPALKTESPSVQKVQLAYLKKLLDLGVTGFRLDVGGRVTPELCDWISKAYTENAEKLGIPVEERILYAENIFHLPEGLRQWKRRNRIGYTAYFVFDLLKEAFSFGESLTKLNEVKGRIEESDTTFTVTHDSLNGGLENYYRMHDASSSKEISRDLILAQQWLLGNEAGISLMMEPLVLVPEIQEALLYRKALQPFRTIKGKSLPIDWQDQYDGSWFQDYTHVYYKGPYGFMAVNKHGTKNVDWSILLHQNTTLEGCYERVFSKENSSVEREYVKISYLRDGSQKIEQTAPLRARSSAFFIKCELNSSSRIPPREGGGFFIK